MRILITGGAGYVGSRLIPYLLQYEHEITVLDWFLFDEHIFDYLLTEDNPRLKLIRGDIRNTILLKQSLTGCEAVIHLAALSNDPTCEMDPDITMQINHDAVLSLLEHAQKAGVDRFIYASSASVYGVKQHQDVTEEDSFEPITLYAHCKAACESAILKSSAHYFTPISLRPATLCGYAPRQRFDLTANIFTYQAWKYRVIKVFGGRQMRPNLAISEMCRVYKLMLEAPRDLVSGQAFNVGFENYSVREIAEIVNDATSHCTAIEVIPTVDHRSYHISSSKLEHTFGYQPEETLKEAVCELFSKIESGALDDPDNIRYRNIDYLKTYGFPEKDWQ